MIFLKDSVLHHIQTKMQAAWNHAFKVLYPNTHNIFVLQINPYFMSLAMPASKVLNCGGGALNCQPG